MSGFFSIDQKKVDEDRNTFSEAQKFKNKVQRLIYLIVSI